jgi:hypothetical protein
MKGLMDLPERILDKIEALPDAPGCWLWTGCLNRAGYGKIRWQGEMTQAHRTVYELLIGPITKRTLDHKCRTRCCVNPEHLRPATDRENLLALGSLSLAAIHAAKTHCPRGHPYNEVNTIRSGDARYCRECRVVHNREWHAQHRERRNSYQRGRRSKNREKTNAYQRELYSKHREVRRAQDRAYRAKRKAHHEHF